MTLGQLKATLGFDTAGLKAAGAALSRFVGETKTQLQGLERFFDRSGKGLTSLGNKLSIALSAPLIAFGIFAARQAQEAETVGRRFESAFGTAFASTRLEIQRLSKVITSQGATSLELLAARTKALVQSLDVAPAKAREMALGLIKMAGAVERIKGVDVAEALDAMRSSLAGSTKGLREFDIAIDDAAIKQEALRLGILHANEELTAAGRAQVTYNLLQRQTIGIQAQAATATETSAQKFQRFRKDLADSAQALGERLLPSLAVFLQRATSVLQVLNQLDPSLVNTLLTIGGIGIAIGPVLSGLGQLVGGLGTLVGVARSLVSATALGGLLGILGPIGLALGAVAVGGLFLFGRQMAENVKQTIAQNRELQQLDKTLSTLSQSQNNVPFMQQWVEDTDEALGLMNRFKRLVDDLKPLGGGFSALLGVSGIPKKNTALNALGANATDVRIILEELGLGPNATAGQVMEKIEQEVNRLGERRAKLVEAINNAKRLGDLGGGGAGDFGGDLVTSTKTEIELLEDSVKNMAQTFEQIPVALQKQEQFWLRIQELQGQTRIVLAAQKDDYGEIATRARELLATLKQIEQSRPPAFLAIGAGAETMQDVIDRLQPQIGITPGARAIVPTVDIKGAAKQVRESTAAIFGEAKASVIELGDAAAKTLTGMRNGFNAINDILSTQVRSVITLVDSLQDAASTVKAIRAVSAADKAKGGTGGITLAGIASLAGAALSIGGAIGSLISALGAHAREIRAALRSNEEAIAAAALDLAGGLDTPAKIQNAAKAARAAELAGVGFGFSRVAQEARANSVNEALKAFGLTLKDINAIAQSQGIKLFDSKGFIIQGAFEQLARRLGITEKELGKLGDTTSSLTESLTNVPTWYKTMLNQNRFNAAAPLGIVPPSTAGEHWRISPGAIIINVTGDAVKDADKVANAVLNRMKQKARRQSGNPTLHGNVS